MTNNMPFPRMNYTYTLTNRAGQMIAEVRIDDPAKPMVRWVGESEWEVDREALGMVLFPRELGLLCR